MKHVATVLVPYYCIFNKQIVKFMAVKRSLVCLAYTIKVGRILYANNIKNVRGKSDSVVDCQKLHGWLYVNTVI